MTNTTEPEAQNAPGTFSRREFLTATGSGLALSSALTGCATGGKSAATSNSTPAPVPQAPFDSLRDYVAAMDAHGNVMRIAQVDQDAFEGTALMYRLVDRYGIYRTPVVIFDEVKINGQWIQGPVIGNQLRHVEAETLLFGLEPVPDDDSATWHRARAHLDTLIKNADGRYPVIPPVEIAAAAAPCKQVILIGEDIDIERFPFFRNNPGDSGRFINTTAVITSDPEMGINFGTYRCEIKGPRHIAVGSGEGQTGYTMLMRAKERGERTVPVTLIVGMDPMVWLVSGSRVSGRLGKKPVDELATAGGLRGKAIEVVKCETNDFLVPASCEMVIEGEITLDQFEVNGPYGESTGYIGAPYESAFTMTVTRITHRRDPWIVNDFTGVTRPMIEQPGAALTVAQFKTLIPNIRDYRYQDSVTWISIAKDKPGQALEAGKRVAKMIPVYKIIIMVDADVDLWNASDRFMAFATRWQAWPASYIYENLKTNPLEPSSPKREQTSKIVIDATRQWPEEGGPEQFPDYSRQVLEENAPDVFSVVDAKWGAQIDGMYKNKA